MRNKKIILTLIMAFSIVLFAFSFSFALEGEGEGNGENQDEGLYIVKSNVNDGDMNISTSLSIELEFNKNVVNMTVAENNKASISLLDKKENPVPINIRLGDDQVDPTVKRLIGITPVTELEEGATYTLWINGDFKAKNGTQLNNPITLSFQTKGPPAQPVIDLDVVEEETKVSMDVNVPALEKDQSLLLIFSVFCLGAGLVLLVYYIMRRKNEK